MCQFLISTKRHLNHLSVSYRSSGARRQAGQDNKQTNTPPSYLSRYKLTNAAKGGGNQTTKPARLPPAHPANSASRHPNDTAHGEVSAQPSVNRNFLPPHRVYNTVSGSHNECREAEGAISQPSPRGDVGPPPPHTQTTNHRGTVIDVSSCFEIYHPDQVAVETPPDRLLNIA